VANEENRALLHLHFSSVTAASEKIKDLSLYLIAASVLRECIQESWGLAQQLTPD
jgi:hypothetical protein